MEANTANLASLIGSRICHDLISPVGAINNGLELLTMSGGVAGPELELISDSVGNANARIRFFRIAFGAAGEQPVGRPEITSVLRDLGKGSRLEIRWMPKEGASRSEVRLAFLAALCVETALPYGGLAEISCEDGTWRVTGSGRKVNVDAALWGRISGAAALAPLTPAQVQFAMLPEAARDLGRSARFEQTGSEISILF